ncbi:MAG: hypothetical protein M1812_000756 [Candelaria pacifica]|nr:MAG: hypothetical protein M1812_000756 [Candelaria pacifica]
MSIQQLHYTLFALVALFCSYAVAVQNLRVQGSDFVNNVTNARFQIIGVAYQPGGASGFNPGSGVDPLSNGTICLRDAALMQRLGVNTIRVYNLDPELDHDLCASIFNAVGIYMLLDVNSPLPGQSINRGDPGSSYNSDYLSRIFAVVENFKNYPNTLGFFGGNEVINDDTSSGIVPPYVRAVNRDLKNYIAAHVNRTIPVGYSAADVRPILADTWSYFQCAINGTADLTRADFFGLNSYSWCGDSNFEMSEYNQLVAQFSNTTVPVFFSEYGCNKVKPRIWTEVQALYGSQMTGVFSGGIVYEWTQEENDFGLAVFNDNGTVQLRTDFDNLQIQLNKLNVTTLEKGNASATAVTPPQCSSGLITSSSFSNKFIIPDPPNGAADLIKNGISNPKQGKLVGVTDTKVSLAVQGSNGNMISNLAIKPLPNDSSNTPNGDNTSGASSISSSSPSATASTTGTAPSATQSKKAAASKESTFTWLWGLAVVAGLASWVGL